MGRPSGHVQGRPQQCVNAAKIAPDVINLSVSEGWVSEYAGKGLLLGLNDVVPKTVQDIYFPGLWNEQLVDGQNFQFPWYQGLSVELINKAIYDKTGLTVDAFPKTVDGAAGRSARRSSTRPGTVCTIRLTVSDLLAQMVYEGNVKVYNQRQHGICVQLAGRRRLAPDVRRHGHRRDGR